MQGTKYSFEQEKWLLKRVDLSSVVKINTFTFRVTLLGGLSRGGGLSKGRPPKRGSTED